MGTPDVLLCYGDDRWLGVVQRRLGEGVGVALETTLDRLHLRLLGGEQPALVLVADHEDEPGGEGGKADSAFRSLELLDGLLPTARVAFLSQDGERSLEGRRVLERGMADAVVRFDDLSTFLDTWVAGASGQRPQRSRGGGRQLRITFREPSVDEDLRALELDVEAKLRLAFPLDEAVQVLGTPRGFGGSIGLAVLTLPGPLRQRPEFYFLKVARGEHQVQRLKEEAANHRRLWRAPLATEALPRQYGLLFHGDAAILIYEYAGVGPAQDGVQGWGPVHFSDILRGQSWPKRPFDTQRVLQQVTDPLIAMREVGGGPQVRRGLGCLTQQEIDDRCDRAVARIVAAAAPGPEGPRSVRIRRMILEDDRLDLAKLHAEGPSIRNPIRRLRTMVAETADLDFVVAGSHGDMHADNLVQRRLRKGSWMVIDFESARSNALSTMDAARLECDLIFNRTPRLEPRAQRQLAQALMEDFSIGATPTYHLTRLEHIETSDERRRDLAPVLDSVYYLRLRLNQEMEQRRSPESRTSMLAPFEVHYLWALLYESVRWIRPDTPDALILLRLLYGAAICDALDQSSPHGAA